MISVSSGRRSLTAPRPQVAGVGALALTAAAATGVLVAVFGPLAALALGGSLLAGLSFLRPDIGIAALVLIVAVLPPAPTSIGVGEVSFGLVWAGSLAGWMVSHGRHRTFDHLDRLVLLLLTMMVLSATWGISGGTSADLWFRGLVPFLGLAVILPARDYYGPDRGNRILMVALYGGGLIAALQTFLSGGAGFSQAVEAGNALFIRSEISPAAYQIPLIAPLAFALGAALIGQQRRWLHTLMLITLGAAASLTLLRSLVMILLMLMAIALVVLVRNRRHVALLVAMGGASLILFLGTVLGLFATTSPVGLLIAGYVNRFSLDSESARASEMAAVWRVFLESPLVGHGMGFQYSYFRTSLGEVWVGGYTHNVVTYFLLTLGLVGVLLLAPLLLGVLRRAWAVASSYTGPGRTLAAGLAFIVFAVVVYGMVQSTFRTLGYSLALAIAVGTLAAFQQRSIPEAAAQPGGRLGLSDVALTPE